MNSVTTVYQPMPAPKSQLKAESLAQRHIDSLIEHEICNQDYISAFYQADHVVVTAHNKLSARFPMYSQSDDQA